MIYKNKESYPDPTAGAAIREADRPPENVMHFRQGIKLLCVICHVQE